MARSELGRWRAEHPHAKAIPADCAPVRDALSTVKLSAIMAACVVGKATASGWRTGRQLPPLRHWQAVAELAGVPL
jgi:hypothetical protein